MPAEDHRVRQKATLLFVGILDQYHRYKGLGYLIEALNIIKETWPDVRLDVVGKGELVEEYRELANHLGIGNRICFHGYVDDQRLSDFYRSRTVFVLPSIDFHEGFGIVLLEAMAHGMPVITTDVTGLSEEIQGNCAGFIVPRKDPKALAKAIEVLLSNSQTARETGENGKKLVQDKYLWKNISKQVVNIYEAAAR
jgi:glycosyltransferase involved in cell wall biosynthesis